MLTCVAQILSAHKCYKYDWRREADQYIGIEIRGHVSLVLQLLLAGNLSRFYAYKLRNSKFHIFSEQSVFYIQLFEIIYNIYLWLWPALSTAPSIRAGHS